MTEPMLPQDSDIMADLELMAVLRLQGVGVPEPVASDLAAVLTSDMRARWGGQVVYVRKQADDAVERRNLEIYRECNGTNQEQLARKYDLALPVIYRIVRQVGLIERAKRQSDLFKENEQGRA